MKNIDIKSMIIGVLLATTIIFGMGATSPTDKWDDKQEWRMLAFQADAPGARGTVKHPVGWEPFAVTDRWNWFRKRIK